MLAIAGAFAASGARGAPASSANGPLTVVNGRAVPTYVLTAEYEGTYHFEDHQEFQGEKLDSIETYRWDAHGTLTVRGDTGAVLSSRYTLAASGRLYLNSTNGGKPIIEDCTFKQLPQNQLKSMDGIVSIQPRVIGKLTGFGAAFTMPDTVGYQVSVTDKNGNCNMFKGSSMLFSNTATEGTVDNVDGFLQNNLWLRAFGSPAFSVSLGGRLRQPIDVEQTGRNANETAKRSVHGVWTLGGPAGPSVQATPEEVRNYASQRWKDLVPIYRDVFFAEAGYDAVRDTLVASWYGLKPPDIQKYIGPAFFKRTFFPVVTQVDQIMAKTLALLENAYNDPPLADYARVARVTKANVSSQLASCAPGPTVARSFCERFRNAALAWTAALGRMESLAQALATTVGRESGAAKAHDAKALLRQQQAGLALIPKLQVAEAGEETASKGLAAAMRSGHFDPRLTADQAQHGIALVLHDLAARGVSAQDVDAILGGAALQARPLDLISLLDGKLSAPSPPVTAPAAGTITSVTFAGSQQSPSIVVRGQNLGQKPAPNPSGSPSNKPPLCPVTIQGNAGLDYGTSLYLTDDTRSLAAGRYRPSNSELDCVGLVVTKFSPSEVDYRFGSFYAQAYPKYAMQPGDTVQVAVNGATKTVHVKYGATVTS